MLLLLPNSSAVGGTEPSDVDRNSTGEAAIDVGDDRLNGTASRETLLWPACEAGDPFGPAAADVGMTNGVCGVAGVAGSTGSDVMVAERFVKNCGKWRGVDPAKK